MDIFVPPWTIIPPTSLGSPRDPSSHIDRGPGQTSQDVLATVTEIHSAQVPSYLPAPHSAQPVLSPLYPSSAPSLRQRGAGQEEPGVVDTERRV